MKRGFVFGGSLFLEFYGSTFRTYLHPHWLIDVCFVMLNAVLMSPLSHRHNNDYLLYNDCERPSAPSVFHWPGTLKIIRKCLITIYFCD